MEHLQRQKVLEHFGKAESIHGGLKIYKQFTHCSRAKKAISFLNYYITMSISLDILVVFFFAISKAHQHILKHRIKHPGIRKKEVYKSVMFVYSGKEKKLIKQANTMKELQ